MENKFWKCNTCAKEFGIGESFEIEYELKCPVCAGTLELSFRRLFPWSDLNQETRGIVRYEALLPVSLKNLSVICDAKTPEFTEPINAPNLAKMIGAKTLHLLPCISGPGGTFKDVEAALVVSKCIEWNLQNRRLSWHSTGNTARAYREYAIRGGFSSNSYFPLSCLYKWNGIQENKNNTLIAYAGPFQKISEIAKKISKEKNTLHLAPLAWKIEGKAPIAYAIMEKLSETGTIVQTIAGGYGPLGMYLGLKRLKGLSLLAEIPRFEMYQIEGADTIARLLPLDREIIETDLKLAVNPYEPTLQSTNPLSTFNQVREMVKATGSTVTSVSVDKIQASKDIFAEECAKLGINISFEDEKSPFISWAGLLGEIEKGRSFADQDMVLVVTGSPQRPKVSAPSHEVIKS